LNKLIQGLSSWNCFCLTPTNFYSELHKRVIFGCIEHDLEFDQASIYSIEEHLEEKRKRFLIYRIKNMEIKN